MAPGRWESRCCLRHPSSQCLSSRVSRCLRRVLRRYVHTFSEYLDGQIYDRIVHTQNSLASYEPINFEVSKQSTENKSSELTLSTCRIRSVLRLNFFVQLPWVHLWGYFRLGSWIFICDLQFEFLVKLIPHLSHWYFAVAVVVRFRAGFLTPSLEFVVELFTPLGAPKFEEQSGLRWALDCIVWLLKLVSKSRSMPLGPRWKFEGTEITGVWYDN